MIVPELIALVRKSECISLFEQFYKYRKKEEYILWGISMILDSVSTENVSEYNLQGR